MHIKYTDTIIHTKREYIFILEPSLVPFYSLDEQRVLMEVLAEVHSEAAFDESELQPGRSVTGDDEDQQSREPTSP